MVIDHSLAEGLNVPPFCLIGSKLSGLDLESVANRYLLNEQSVGASAANAKYSPQPWRTG
jgi:hypothetical protein